MKKRFVLLFLLPVLIGTVSSCSGGDAGDRMRDGYYTAETAQYDVDGWKEYVSIYVSNNEIVTVEYDAHNFSGFIRSWDIEYMREKAAKDGYNPNTYARIYTAALLNQQNPDGISPVYGAVDSLNIFKKLVTAAMEKARAGDRQVAIIEN